MVARHETPDPTPAFAAIVSGANRRSVDASEESFSFDALMIHAWLNQLIEEAGGLYIARNSAKNFGLQTGQAQRGFLRIFGHPKDDEIQRFAQNMYRFAGCDDPLAIILFRALDGLSTEHDAAGEYGGLQAFEASAPPREAVRRLRESMDRWFEWVDAFVHVQTHAQWHLSPECFDADPAKRENAVEALKQQRIALFQACRNASWKTRDSDTTQFYRQMPLWQALPQAPISQPQRPWPHPELDEAIISLWPLLRRHHWTFADLLSVLRDLLPESDAYPCADEKNLATYCAHTLRLRTPTRGQTAREARPAGYLVALRLFPPLPPRPVFSVGPRDSEEPSSA